MKKLGDVEITYSPLALNPWRATLGDISVSGRTEGQTVQAMVWALERQIAMLPRGEQAMPPVRLVR